VANYKIVYWQDIPSFVQATEGSEKVKLELSERSQVLIDAVAMRLGLAGADEYLDQWHHGDVENRPGSAREVAQAVVAELEGRFSEFQKSGSGGS
jgi:cvfA/B/C family virulence factor